MKYVFLLIFLPVVSLAQQADHLELKTLLKNISEAKDSLKKAVAFEQLGGYFYEKIPERAVFYLEQATKLYLENGKMDQVAIGYLNIGSAYDEKLKDYPKAAHYLGKARLEWQKLNNLLQEANVLKYLGWIQAKLGDFPTAKSNIQNAIRKFEEKKFEPGVAVSFFDLANVFQLEGKTDSSLHYVDQAIFIWKKLDNKARHFGVNNLKMKLLLAKNQLQLVEKIFAENEQFLPETDLHWSEILIFYQRAENFFTLKNDATNAEIYGSKQKKLQEGLRKQGIEIGQ